MSAYLPVEIIEKILLWLPVRSLMKFTLVCTEWKSLIKSTDFIESHFRNTIASNDENDSHLLLLSATSSSADNTRRHHHRLHWDTPEFGEHSTIPTPVIKLKNKPVSDLSVVGTSNGLVCLELGTSGTPVVIWNPSIRKVIRLPKPPPSSNSNDRCTTLGFGYDALSNDYKILRVVSDEVDDYDDPVHLRFRVMSDVDGTIIRTFAQVYSLARRKWKKLRDSVIPLNLRGGAGDLAFVNGTFHVVEASYTTDSDGDGEYYSNDGDMVIRTFNLATEKFGEMMGPEEASITDHCSVARYGDSLAFSEDHDIGFRDGGCDIWLMNQYGVAESWTKVFNISVPRANIYSLANIYGLKRCGHLVLKVGSAMIFFDPDSERYLALGTEDRRNYFMDSFVESLVLLHRRNAISYREQ